MSYCQKPNMSTCLHDVILENDLEKLDKALLQPNIDINCTDMLGDTPLVTSLRRKCSDAFITRLIDAGCDVNKSNPMVSPLHIALTRSSVEIARRMIRKGANVNAWNTFKLTPLQSAVIDNKLEAVYLLLDSGADVNIAENPKTSALMMALKWHKMATYKIFYECPNDRVCADKIASTNTGQLAMDLIKSEANVNCISTDGDYPLVHAAQCGSAPLFKLIWSKLNHQTLLDNQVPFLLHYVRKSLLYPASEWLHCLHLILTCPVAHELIRECTNVTSRNIPLISGLLYRLRKFKGADHWITAMELCMNLGATITIPDIDLAIGLYGFGKELETLIYSDNIRKENYALVKLNPLPTFILAFEEDVSVQFVFQLFQNQIKSTFRTNDIVRSLKYFSMPSNMKQQLADLSRKQFPGSHQTILESIQRVPEFPSLLELSRNKARSFIKDIYQVEKPGQFHDAVKMLNLPIRVKDIILFKAPLYW